MKLPGEPAEQELNGGEVDEGFAGFGIDLVVLGQSPTGGEPGEGALHHPPARVHLEALLAGQLCDDLQRPAVTLSDGRYAGGEALVHPAGRHPWAHRMRHQTEVE